MKKFLILIFIVFFLYGSIFNLNAKRKSSKQFLVGTIIMYAGVLEASDIERLHKQGWLVCDGRTENIAKYKTLYNVIKDKFSLENEVPNKFRIPNLVARVPIGANTWNIKPEDSPKNSALKYDGAISPNLGEYGGNFVQNISKDQISHKHNVSGTTSSMILNTIEGWRGQSATNGPHHHHTFSTKSDDVSDFKQFKIKITQPYLALHFLIRYK